MVFGGATGAGAGVVVWTLGELLAVCWLFVGANRIRAPMMNTIANSDNRQRIAGALTHLQILVTGRIAITQLAIDVARILEHAFLLGWFPRKRAGGATCSG